MCQGRVAKESVGQRAGMFTFLASLCSSTPPPESLPLLYRFSRDATYTHPTRQTAKGLLVNITGGEDLTLFEVDEAASRVTDEVDDSSANIIVGSTYDSGLSGAMRVSVVATGERAPRERGIQRS